MNLENKKLGRGLDSLLSPRNKTDDKNFKFINISEIQANQNQPRKNFNKEELGDLANSIKFSGKFFLNLSSPADVDTSHVSIIKSLILFAIS